MRVRPKLCRLLRLLVAVSAGVTMSVPTQTAIAQQREWRTLRPGTLVRLVVERDSSVWAFVAVDSARIDLRGPCTGRDRFDCPQAVLSLRFSSISAAARRTDRVLEGTVIGAGLGAGIGALGYLRNFREGPGSWGDYTTPLFAAIGALVGGIVGSNSHRWVSLPPP
jgi:hypothetical protein